MLTIEQPFVLGNCRLPNIDTQLLLSMFGPVEQSHVTIGTSQFILSYMGTQSHFLMTLAFKRRRDQLGKPTHGRALLLGSFMPDIPLFVFTVAWIAYWYFFTDRSEFFFGPTYDDIYFNNPWMKVGHSIFHSPIPIAIMILLGYWGMQNAASRMRDYGKFSHWSGNLFWFGLGCSFHSIVDILTHHDDGPLIFFPFDWQTRFESPISYWHPDHYGTEFGRFELALDVAIILWLLLTWWNNRRLRRAEIIYE